MFYPGQLNLSLGPLLPLNIGYCAVRMSGQTRTARPWQICFCGICGFGTDEKRARCSYAAFSEGKIAFMNIKSSRQSLGMSIAEFAALHQISTDAVRRWEKPKGGTGYREPSGSAKAFTQALLEGYRPKVEQLDAQTRSGVGKEEGK